MMQPEEVTVTKTVGAALVECLSTLEKRMYAQQEDALDALKPLTTAVSEALDKQRSEEEKGK